MPGPPVRDERDVVADPRELEALDLVHRYLPEEVRRHVRAEFLVQLVEQVHLVPRTRPVDQTHWSPLSQRIVQRRDTSSRVRVRAQADGPADALTSTGWHEIAGCLRNPARDPSS